MQKTVAILGAGPSGLVAAKEAISNGLIPTVFEKQCDIGGVWNPYSGSVWNTLRTNISKYTTAYGDAEWPEGSDMFPSSKSVFEYLSKYADCNDLRKCIKFNCTVEKVTPVVPPKSANSDKNLKVKKGTSGWEVSWVSVVLKEKESKVFDGVIVATGIFGEPNIPQDINGLENFQGKLLHSKEYKTGDVFKDQRVLVVGGSFSGSEISADVSYHAKETIHIFRNPFWILDRYLPDASRNYAKLPVDWVFYDRKFYKQKQIQPPTSQPAPLPSKEDVFKGKNNNLKGFCQAQETIDELKVPLEAFGRPITTVISDQYISQIKSGKVTPMRQSILEVNGSKVKLENGKVQEVDCIIFATGFNIGNHSIFDQDILDIIGFNGTDRLQPLILFNATLHPELSNLFFVGMYKGPYFAVMEQQARWACKILSNKVQLPPIDLMLEGLAIEMKTRTELPRPQFPHPDYVNFADKIATLGHSFPNIDKLQRDNFSLSDALGKPLKGVCTDLENRKDDICKMLMTQPALPAHYNLVDNPKQVVEKMEKFEHLISEKVHEEE